ncbi:hypothetical protein [Rosistilla oblonga]|uniref:hypothetical protein n=1 Tax=Rosistilla oblonga TaxID=2527990 RepID=UPI003A978FDF
MTTTTTAAVPTENLGRIHRLNQLRLPVVVDSLDVTDQSAGDAERIADFVAGPGVLLWKIFHNRILRLPDLPFLRPLVIKIASPKIARCTLNLTMPAAAAFFRDLRSR